MRIDIGNGYVKHVDHMGSDSSVLEAARMSTATETGIDKERDERLRRYLWTHRHTSPFEMIELVVEVNCPIFVLRQIDRHRTVRYSGDAIETVDDTRIYTSRNEYSGRYSEMLDEAYIPTEDRISGDSRLNRQQSGDKLPPETRREAVEIIERLTHDANAAYARLRDMGVAKELARVVLPVSQMTRVRLKASGLAWMRFLTLRCSDDVQQETREYAEAIRSIFRDAFPLTAALLE
jgi:thymidylate synthase (FAD)